MKHIIRITWAILFVVILSVLLGCDIAEEPETITETAESESEMSSGPSVGLAFVSNGDGTCYVSGRGTCADVNIVIPSESPEGDTVTGIGETAFSGCDDLTSITIPTGVTSIRTWAFLNCTSLTNIDVPDSVKSIEGGAFSGCASLTSIYIPDAVTMLNSGTFSGCVGLTSFVISDKVTSISSDAFSSCSGLTSLVVDSQNSVYHSRDNCVIDTENKILVAGCQNSKIPADGSVTSIGDYAFDGCAGLTSIVIPDSVTSIGAQAFSKCVALTDIVIPDSVTSIGYSSFEGCVGFTSITIPSSITSIGEKALRMMGNGLSSIVVDSGNPVYHSRDNCVIETESKRLIAGCRNSVIPSDGSVTSIGDFAFSGYDELTSITIPVDVTYISSRAFSQYITDVYYPGTQAQWNTIEGANKSLHRATIHCADGDIFPKH